MVDRFIGDMHLFHDSCLAFDNRPFSNIESHNSAIIGNWNNVVDVSDHTYILGDVSFGNVTKTIEVLNELNGTKTLIAGNHCRKLLRNKQFRDCFIEIADYKEVGISRLEYCADDLILCHYPIMCFNNQFRNAIHLYAHVHNSQQFHIVEHMKRLTEEERGKGTCRMFNVGCMLDYMNYTPRTLHEILEACENDGVDVLKNNRRYR